MKIKLLRTVRIVTDCLFMTYTRANISDNEKCKTYSSENGRNFLEQNISESVMQILGSDTRW